MVLPCRGMFPIHAQIAPVNVTVGLQLLGLFAKWPSWPCKLAVVHIINDDGQRRTGDCETLEGSAVRLVWLASGMHTADCSTTVGFRTAQPGALLEPLLLPDLSSKVSSVL